jgi:Family of unknown function (DUF5899)
MADPISIAAILALMYTGRAISNKVETYTPVQPVQENTSNYQSMSRITNGMREPGYLDVPSSRKQEVKSFGEIATNIGKNPTGQVNADVSSRMYVSGVMNNLSSTEKVLVGRGLGLDPNIAATGGFQQLYRVNPNNVGAYRLTSLPGRVAPGGDITGNRRGMIGELTHFAPSKTAFLPSRRPNVKGRAQGQGGAISGQQLIESYEKTKRTTNRSETTLRTDGLEYAPAKRFVSGSTSQEEPSRNKTDKNTASFYHTDAPQPDIHSFRPGYTNDPSMRVMNGEALATVGIKVADKRGNPDRMGNAGRMNVRADPLNQTGMQTTVRIDSNKNDGYIGAVDGSRGQVYVAPLYTDLNANKPNSETLLDLDVAKRQLMSNPFARSIF